jgi:hypothetical protein
MTRSSVLSVAAQAMVLIVVLPDCSGSAAL